MHFYASPFLYLIRTIVWR